MRIVAWLLAATFLHAQPALEDVRIAAFPGAPEPAKIELFARHGFNVLAIESNWPEPLPVDMVEWARVRKVKAVAFGVRRASPAVQHLLAYLSRVDPPTAAEYARILEEVTTAEKEAALYATLPGHEKRLVYGAAVDFALRFDRNKAQYVARSSEVEWSLAKRHAQFVCQAVSLQDPGARERYMAENLKWILDQEPASEKVMLWVNDARQLATVVAHLRRMYGDRAVVLGDTWLSAR